MLVSIVRIVRIMRIMAAWSYMLELGLLVTRGSVKGLLVTRGSVKGLLVTRGSVKLRLFIDLNCDKLLNQAQSSKTAQLRLL